MIKLKNIGRGLSALLIGTVTWALLVNLSGESKSMPRINFVGPTTISNQQLPKQHQGIKGVVLSVSGNQMPSPNQPRSSPRSVSTKVWIFSGKIMGPGSPYWSLEKAKKHPSLIGWTLSDSKGIFKVGLPSGEYTLLVESGENVYLNSFLGDGSYSSVQVCPNEITEIQIFNTENAFY